MGSEHPKGRLWLAVPPTNLTWNPVSHKALQEIVQNNLEKCLCRNSASTLFQVGWQVLVLFYGKKKLLLREVNHYYQEQLLFYHIDSVLILITDTIFVKFKTGKYALIIKEMIRERTDF